MLPYIMFLQTKSEKNTNLKMKVILTDKCQYMLQKPYLRVSVSAETSKNGEFTISDIDHWLSPSLIKSANQIFISKNNNSSNV